MNVRALGFVCLFLPCEIVEAVHDDSHDNVEHNEGAEKDERYEVEVGDVGATSLLRVHQFPSGLVVDEGQLVARAAGNAGHHDVRPGFAGRASEKHQEGRENGPEVVVPLNGGVSVQPDVSKQLHSDDGVDEE